MSAAGRTLLIFTALLGFLAANTLFMLRQTEQALVLELGNPKRIEKEPGLKMKIPFIQNVVFFDNRLIDFDADPKEVIAADQKRMIVDAFVRYRITDPLQFYKTVTDERIMRSRLNSIVESSLRQVIGSRPLSALLSEERGKLMNEIKDVVNHQAMETEVEAQNPQEGETRKQYGFGIEVVDVRIKRSDLPQENSQAIFRRMQTDREREAKEFRAQGAEEAQRIRAKADKERTILLAEAQKKAEIIRGEGDAAATRIFAESFGRDPEFFALYRELQAYRRVLGKEDTKAVLSPDSGFLKLFEQGPR